MNKTTTYYFDSAKSLPLAMSYSQIQSLVAETGIPPNPLNSGWGLKNFLIMITSIITLSTAILFSLNTSSNSKYQERESGLGNNYNQEQFISVIDSTKPVTNSETLFKSLIPEKEVNGNENTEIINDVNENSISNLDQKLIIDIKQMDNSIIETDLKIEVDESLGLFEDEIVSGMEETDIKPFGLFDQPEDLLFEQDTTAINGSTKTIRESIALDKVKAFILKNNHGDITIKNGNSNEAQLIATVTIEGKTEEDEQKALKDFELNFETKKDQLSIVHNWTGDQIDDCFCWSSNKKNKYKMSDGESVKLKKVEIEYEIILPSNIYLELTNRYANITVPDRAGGLKAVLFKGDINAGNIQGDLNLTEKYGKAFIKSANDVVFNLFKGELELGAAKEVKGKLSYSELNLLNANSLVLTSFQSDATIKQVINKLTSNFKYGDLTIEKDLTELDLVAFQAKVKAGLIDKSKLNLSYSKFEMTDGNEIELEKAFQSKIYAKTIDAIKGKANYSPIEINKIKGNIDLATFQGSINILSIEPNFTKVNLNTRYTNVDLNFNSSSSYSFEAKTTYTSVNIPSSVQNMDVSSGNSNNHSHLKGQVLNGVEASSSLVYIESFQGKLSLQ